MEQKSTPIKNLLKAGELEKVHKEVAIEFEDLIQKTKDLDPQLVLFLGESYDDFLSGTISIGEAMRRIKSVEKAFSN